MSKSLEEQLKHRPADPERVAEEKEALKRALEQSASGQVVSLGSFAQYAKPLWPLPDDSKPFVTARSGRYELWTGEVYLGSYDHHLDAMNYGRDEARNLTFATEYVQRREALAKFLLELVYGKGAWSEAMLDEREDLVLNYRLDADDIIKANPHLLSLEERERLAGQIPELAYP